jgi:hypothetical protein
MAKGTNRLKFVVEELNRAMVCRPEVNAVEVHLAQTQQDLVIYRFYEHLFEVLLSVSDILVVPEVLKARKLLLKDCRLQPRVHWRRKNKKTMIQWNLVPLMAARAALDRDRASVCRFMQYTAMAVAIHRGNDISLRNARRSLKIDRYGIWAEFAQAFYRVVSEVVNTHEPSTPTCLCAH